MIDTELRPAPDSDEYWLRHRMLAARRVPGGAAPAVFVHGLGGSSLNFTDLAFLLAGELDSWAVDLPGFGFSPPPRDGDYSPAGHARAVADLITERIGAPVHLFGNSMGGAVALQLAARAPDLVASMTLISPALPGARITRFNAHLPVVALPGVGDRILRRYLRAAAQLRTRATIQTVFADTARMHPQRLGEAVAEVTRRDALPYAADAFVRSARGLLTSMLHRGPDSAWALAARVRCPVLLVYGGQDRLVDPRGAARIAARFGDTRTMVLPGSGHVAQMEHPDLVAATWRATIAG